MGKGTAYELKARRTMENRGLTAIRVSNSLGPVDVIAWDAVSTWFVQVKHATTVASRNQAKYAAKKEFGASIFPFDNPVQLWMYYQGRLTIYDWIDGEFILKS